MEKFEIERLIVCLDTVYVFADTEEEARQLALDKAVDWKSCYDSDIKAISKVKSETADDYVESYLHELRKQTSDSVYEYYNEEEIEGFIKYCCNNLIPFESVADSFVDYWWDSDKQCRRCSVCGKIMREGYCLNAGDAYYCSDECLHTVWTQEEWENECMMDDQTYYTEWY